MTESLSSQEATSDDFRIRQAWFNKLHWEPWSRQWCVLLESVFKSDAVQDCWIALTTLRLSAPSKPLHGGVFSCVADGVIRRVSRLGRVVGWLLLSTLKRKTGSQMCGWSSQREKTSQSDGQAKAERREKSPEKSRPEKTWTKNYWPYLPDDTGCLKELVCTALPVKKEHQ